MSSDKSGTSPPTTPSAAIPMPWHTNISKYHWWFDSKSSGVQNSPPSNMTGHYSVLSQSPPAGGDMESAEKRPRRDSLKNMGFFNDFATP